MGAMPSFRPVDAAGAATRAGGQCHEQPPDEPWSNRHDLLLMLAFYGKRDRVRFKFAWIIYSESVCMGKGFR